MPYETLDEIERFRAIYNADTKEALAKRIADAKYVIGCAIYFKDDSDYLSALYSAYKILGGNDRTIDSDISKAIDEKDKHKCEGRT